jgi:hypothetical protein
VLVDLVDGSFVVGGVIGISVSFGFVWVAGCEIYGK